jgi:hypothetical protein
VSQHGDTLTRRSDRRTALIDLLWARTSVASEYKLEVQAIEASGNQTLTEITFHVR